MKRKRKEKELKEHIPNNNNNNNLDTDTTDKPAEKMPRKNKRKKKGLSKGDNRTNTKPAKHHENVVDPFEPCDVTVLKSFRVIKTKEIQALAMHYLGCTRTPPDWCLITNRGEGHKVCVVMIEALYPFIYTAMSVNMPTFTTLFPDGPLEIQNPGSDLYVTPASSAILEKEPRKRSCDSNEIQLKLPPVQDYILSDELRLAHEYPHNEVLSSKTDWKRFTGNVAVNAASVPLYALDCEMCKTSEGMEATQIAIIDETLNCIYKTYIKPPNAILDYLTAYSGVTAEVLENVTTTLADVVKHINNVLPTQAVFIGHSLENDLKALKLYHDNIIDTAIIYGSGKAGFKPGLRFLAQRYLKAKIQCSENGHDPSEDAMTCMRLVKLKVKRGPKFGFTQTSSDNSLSIYLTKQKKSGVFIDKPIVVQQHCHGLAQALPAATDEDGVDTLLRRMSSRADFFWLHLYKLEHVYRSGSTIHDMVNNPELGQCLAYIDEVLKSIYTQLPGDTLLMVYSGCSGYWKKPEFNGSDEAMKKLMVNTVAQVRRGLLFMKVKN